MVNLKSFRSLNHRKDLERRKKVKSHDSWIYLKENRKGLIRKRIDLINCEYNMNFILPMEPEKIKDNEFFSITPIYKLLGDD